MGRIRILSDSLANKIAAGEVVERPASVVKELMENALDAGARHIQLDAEEGGRKLIRVTDDGAGMSGEDLAMSVHPHATSKISCEEDLFAVATMGFRGEALPSIAAVSHVSITTRPHDDIEGHQLQVAGGEASPVSPVGCPPGTAVEVRDLFFNVPARRKFLRTVNTELGYISEQFARIAIAYPHLHLTFTHNGRELHRLTATDSRLTRIGDFYGHELSDSLIPVERAENGLTIDGYVIRPAQSRATTKWQYVFVNGRYVRDRFVLHAVKEAYRGLIDSQRHPGFFLFIVIAPDKIDVNVHPTKIEVRWRESGLIHSQLLSLLRETFQQHDLSPTAETGPTDDDQAEERRNAIRQAMADFFKSQTLVQPAFDFQSRAPSPAQPAPRESSSVSSAFRDRPASSTSPRQPEIPLAPRPAPPPTPPKSEPLTGAEPPPSADLQTGNLPPASKVIQLHNTYLVAETEDGLVIIDQHALHERVMYETFTERLNHGPLESQRLLIPESLPVTAQQLAATEAHVDLLKDLGIEVGPFGTGLLAVHAFPVLLDKVDIASFMRDLLDKLVEAAHTPSRETLIHEMVDMMACKAAVKAGDALNPEEINALLAARQRVERSSNCPHGRPTALRLSLKDLEKQFQRT